MLCAALAASFLLCTGAAALDLGQAVVSSSASLNLRAEPSTGGQKLASMEPGAKVTVLSQSGEWYKVTYASTTGYCSAAYLTIGDGTYPKPASVSCDGPLNLRSLPDSSSDVITAIPSGSSLTVFDGADGWYKAAYGDFVGFVSAQYVELSQGAASDEAKTGTISASGGLNLRAKPDSGSSRITIIPNGARVTITEMLSSGWYKLEYSGKTGYALGKYVRLGGGLADRSYERPNSAKASEIVEYAKKYLGVKYAYGGASPKKGFDCSGFTQYVFSNFGYSLPHSATSQSKLSYGVTVSKSELAIGDLVFFSQGKYAIGHVGIYVGDGLFIHASSPGDVVKYDRMDSSYYSKNYKTARRIIK